MITNCTDHIINTEPKHNGKNYATASDRITEHISNNGYTVIQRGITEPIITEYTGIEDESTRSTLHEEYTAFINVITEHALNDGDMIIPNATRVPTLHIDYISITNCINNFLSTIDMSIHNLDSSIQYDCLLCDTNTLQIRGA